MTNEEYRQKIAEQVMENRDGCSKIMMYGYLIVAAIIFVMCSSCTTKRSTESSIEMHRMALMTERMDSMFHAQSLKPFSHVSSDYQILGVLCYK